MASPRPRLPALARRVELDPAGAAATNVARDPSRFFGRESDLAAVHEIFRGDGKLCTLTGASGIGKTRAAREYALAYVDFYPGGRWFCDLSAAKDNEQACAGVARVLGMPAVVADAAAGVAEQIGEAISTRGRVLVVLDNFEQLLPDGAILVEQWTRAAPDARFLVTSQEILRVPGEYGYELRPLTVPGEDAAQDPTESDAVKLFLDRAQHARAGYAPTAHECAILGEIARGLDGIPLALELAAARMTVLGPDEIRAMLARRFELLARRGATTSRQATLRGAIDWSWNLLADDERDALAQCSVFHGGFTLEAAERVLALPEGGGSVLDAVQTLREKSLLTARPATDGALRLDAFQSILAYASERLEESGRARETRDRHARYFADAAPSWPPARLAADRDNLLCAVEHLLGDDTPGGDSLPRALRALLAYARPVYSLGPLPRYLALLDSALEKSAQNADTRLRAEALAAAAEVRWFQGDLASALARAEQAVRAAREAKPEDPALEGRALGTLGLTLLSSGRLEDSGHALAESLRCHERAGDARSRALTLRSLGQHRLLSGRLDEAAEHFERAREVFRTIGDRFEHARVTIGLAWVAAARGSLDEARGRVAEGIALVGDDAVFSSWVGHLLGEIDADAEDYDAALSHCDRAIQGARAQGHRRAEASMRGYRGMVFAQKGEFAAAREDLAWACTVSPEPRFRALFLAFLAGVDASEGRLELAEARAREAEGALSDARDAFGSAASVQRALVEVLAARAEPAGGVSRRDSAAARIDAAVRLASAGVVLYEVRASLRAFARAAGDDALSPEARRLARGKRGDAHESLQIDREGRWFRWTGGARVSCERRKVLRRILVALVEARLKSPGETLSGEALIAAGWPGEKMLAGAARNRLKFSLALLRRIGLRDAIETAPGGGYRLNPAIDVEWG